MEYLTLVPAMKVIDYLSIEDILNLKLVNKWFYRIISWNLRIKKLVISTIDLPYNTRWFYTYDQISLQHFIKSKSFRHFDLLIKQSMISNQLKRLYIYKIKLLLESLNSFKKLVHLEIINSEIKSKTGNNVLRLPMLECLNLHRPSFFLTLIVDSFKLQRLRFGLIPYGIEFNHPESIIHLEICYYDHCKHFLPFCSNLEHFYCNELDLKHLHEFNLVKKLSKLESIHLDGTRDAFVYLAQEKKRFNKGLKIYFNTRKTAIFFLLKV